ncbi:hypothetical protein C1X05_13170 [Laceyella sacchari]|nr:hypothetical protein C1X05_13170 [Laceyella sacchari]MRG27402.1 hypothetical protein [Laceyella tengchongensis]
MSRMEWVMRDMIRDLLTTERTLSQHYLQAQHISANEELRQTLEQCLYEVNRVQTKLFNEMEQRGWLTLTTAGQQPIESAIIHWEQQLERHPELAAKE